MTQAFAFNEPVLGAPLVGNDTVEVIDEVDRIVYIFLATATRSAEQLVEDWSTSGDPTFAFTRPATDDDLVSASAALETAVS